MCPAALCLSRFLSLAIKQVFKMSQNSPACLLHSSFMISYLPPGDDLLQDWRGREGGESRETWGHLPGGRSLAQQEHWESLTGGSCWRTLLACRLVCISLAEGDKCPLRQTGSVARGLSCEGALCVRHPGRGMYCGIPGNLVTEALWDRIGGGRRWKISGTISVVMVLCWNKYSS